jgi:hypothetical protein
MAAIEKQIAALERAIASLENRARLSIGARVDAESELAPLRAALATLEADKAWAEEMRMAVFVGRGPSAAAMRLYRAICGKEQR